MGKIILTAYISHGAPTSLVERTGIHGIYEKLGRLLKEHGVDTIVVSSPHYLSRGNFEVESREDIPCIQDYYGFPQELYEYSYEAKNDSALAAGIVREGTIRGLPVAGAASWGLDHGAWLPLYFMFPARDVKIVPVSITAAAPREHFRFGQAIKSAVDEAGGNVAVLGTGSPVHRLDLMRFGYYGEERFEPGAEFDEKLIETVAAGDMDRILDIREEYPALYQAAAPEGKLNPLYTALGASDADELVGKTLLHEFMYYGVSLVATILSAEADLYGALRRQGSGGEKTGAGSKTTSGARGK